MGKASVIYKEEGIFHCEYLAPTRCGNYKIHIKLDAMDILDSPYFIFFKTTTLMTGSNLYNKDITINKNENYHDGITATSHDYKPPPFILDVIQKFKTESTTVKVTNVSPFLTLNKIQEVFY